MFRPNEKQYVVNYSPPDMNIGFSRENLFSKFQKVSFCFTNLLKYMTTPALFKNLVEPLSFKNWNNGGKKILS